MTGKFASAIRLTQVDRNLMLMSLMLTLISASYVMPVKPSARRVF